MRHGPREWKERRCDCDVRGRGEECGNEEKKLEKKHTMRRDVSTTAVKLLMMGRNRSWTSHTKRAVSSGSSFPMREGAVSREDIAAATD